MLGDVLLGDVLSRRRFVEETFCRGDVLQGDVLYVRLTLRPLGMRAKILAGDPQHTLLLVTVYACNLHVPTFIQMLNAKIAYEIFTTYNIC